MCCYLTIPFVPIFLLIDKVFFLSMFGIQIGKRFRSKDNQIIYVPGDYHCLLLYAIINNTYAFTWQAT